MGAVAAGLAPSAAAHPHVWATVRSKIVFAPGHKITGIRPAWTFDKRYTAMAVQGLYGDGDGVYSKEEFEPLAKINFDLLKELALTQGLFWAGVAATFAMAFGTAITVAPLATLALGSRELLLKFGGGNDRWAEAVWTSCALGGALVVLTMDCSCSPLLSAQPDRSDFQNGGMMACPAQGTLKKNIA